MWVRHKEKGPERPWLIVVHVVQQQVPDGQMLGLWPKRFVEHLLVML